MSIFFIYNKLPSDDIQELLALIAEREQFSKLATQCSKRINNIIVCYGLTISRTSSVTINPDIRAVLDDLISGSFPIKKKKLLTQLFTQKKEYQSVFLKDFWLMIHRKSAFQ